MTSKLIYMASQNEDATGAGLVVAELNDETGELTIVQEDRTMARGDYLNFHPSRPLLYATEIGDHCAIHAFGVDTASGKLTALNHLPANGTSPCYVSVDARGEYALMVNYNTKEGPGNIRVYSLAGDGTLIAETDVLEHEGGSVNPNRQQEPHPHMIVTTPDGRYVIVPDLGTDKIHIYQLNNETGKMSAHTTLDMEPGAGVRHVAFHPTQPYMYAINELNSTLVAYRYSASDGSWEQLTIVPTLPDNYKADPDDPNYPADVHVHPNGKFLYGSNRGHDSIVIYAIDEETGIPRQIGHQSTLGHWPRAFMIEPDGKYMLVGNQYSHTVQVFRINGETGELEHVSKLDLPAPMGFKVPAVG